MNQRQQHMFKIGTKISATVLLLLVIWDFLLSTTVQNAIIQFLFAGVVPISHRVLTPDSVIYGVVGMISVIFLATLFRILQHANFLPEIHLSDFLPTPAQHEQPTGFPVEQVSSLEPITEPLFSSPPLANPAPASAAIAATPSIIVVPVVVASPPVRKPVTMPHFEMPKVPKLDWQPRFPSVKLPHVSLPVLRFGFLNRIMKSFRSETGQAYQRSSSATRSVLKRTYQGAPLLIKPPLHALAVAVDTIVHLIELTIKYTALGIYLPLKAVAVAVWYLAKQIARTLTFIGHWTVFLLQQSVRYLFISIRTILQAIVVSIITLQRAIVFGITWSAVMLYRILTRSAQLLFYGTVTSLKASRKATIWTLTTVLRVSIHAWWRSEPYLRRYDRWLEKHTKRSVKKADYRLRRYGWFQVMLDVVRAVRFELGRLGIGKSVDLYRQEHKRRQI